MKIRREPRSPRWIPLRNLLLAVLGAFLVEECVMLYVMPSFAGRSRAVVSALDSLVLIAGLLPLLFIFIYRPLTREIRRRIRVEAELRNTVQQREDLLSIASHDIKNPLTALQLRLQFAGRQLAEAPLTSESVEKARRSLDQATDHVRTTVALLDQLLDFSRLRAGKIRLHPEPLDLRTFLLQAVERTRPLAKERGSQLLVDVALDLEVEWDRVRMEQIINNLLSNAVKFGAGRPTRLGADQPSDENCVRIRVTDEGQGIPPEQLGAIFNRFERAEATGQLGHGIGLFIVKTLTEAHGGSVRVTSEVGRGSTFEILLPVSR